MTPNLESNLEYFFRSTKIQCFEWTKAESDKVKAVNVRTLPCRR